MEKRERQSEIFNALQKYIKVNKIPPTMRELCQIVGLKSTASMWIYIKRLQKQGYISMIDSSLRSIKIEESIITMNKKELWEKQSNSYNSMFAYLKSKGLNESELIDFSQLLSKYIKFI